MEHFGYAATCNASRSSSTFTMSAIPKPRSYPHGHRWRDLQGLMDTHEIVVHELDRHHMRVANSTLVRTRVMVERGRMPPN